MAFDQAAVRGVYNAALSDARQLNIFEVVYAFEPKAAPTSLPALAVWWDHIVPVAAVSGLSATSGRVSLRGRIYKNFMSRPEGQIDVELLSLTSTLIGAYSGGFTFGGTVMEVDLLGAHGEQLAARSGYIEHDGRHFRVAEVNIPVIISDLWTQVA